MRKEEKKEEKGRRRWRIKTSEKILKETERKPEGNISQKLKKGFIKTAVSWCLILQ